MTFKLGKRPASNRVTFKLRNYVDFSKFPKTPASFGHEGLIGAKGWGMMGNDQYGDCVFAGAAHETMLWNKEAMHSASFSEASVLGDYAAVTGFNPSDPSTDQGTDMAAAASYRRKVGVADAASNRHQVAAYLALTPGDLHEHFLAIYLFGAVGIGIEFPASAMDQFNHGKPWTHVSRSRIEGGHYVPLVARRHGHLTCVTWGQTQEMTDGFFHYYNDESLAYVSLEALTSDRSPEGFDSAQLLADLSSLGH